MFLTTQSSPSSPCLSVICHTWLFWNIFSILMNLLFVLITHTLSYLKWILNLPSIMCITLIRVLCSFLLPDIFLKYIECGCVKPLLHTIIFILHLPDSFIIWFCLFWPCMYGIIMLLWGIKKVWTYYLKHLDLEIVCRFSFKWLPMDKNFCCFPKASKWQRIIWN